MSESSYSKLRKALDQARAQNASDEEVIDCLVEVAKSSPVAMEALKTAYRESVKKNKTDFAAAVEDRIFDPTSGSAATGHAATSGPLTKGVAHLLTNLPEPSGDQVARIAKRRTSTEDIAKRAKAGSKIAKQIREPNIGGGR